jgi:hypothetical protein
MGDFKFYDDLWRTYPLYYSPQPTKTYIIIGTSGAAKHPMHHPSLASAETEANRLAKQHPGQEFTIYSTVKSFKVEEKPVTVKTFV